MHDLSTSISLILITQSKENNHRIGGGQDNGIAHHLCVPLIGTISAAPVKQQSDLNLYTGAKLQSKNLLGYHISANNKANVQTGLANGVDYKGAIIEAVDSLPAET